MTRKLIVLSALLVTTLHVFAQRDRLDAITDSITAEGKALYRSEWASWYGTDIFLAKCVDKRDLSGGYFSYETANNLVNVFFSKDEQPQAIASITFEKDFNSNNFKLDTTTRKFTAVEQDYYNIRKAATTHMYGDTIFKGYKNTTLNVVPMIRNGQRKAYVLTGTSLHGVVIFGNDYLINLDESNSVISATSLHKNIIPNYLKTDSGQVVKSAFHNHLPPTSEFITATDICTLMLYKKFTTWETYSVVSKNYVSIWDCTKNELVILTMEAWKKIADDQKTRHPQKE